MGRAGIPPLSQCSEPDRAGSSRVQFFVRRARRSRYPPTTATPARPRTSSAFVPVWDRPRPGVVAAPVAEALGAPAALVGCAMVPSAGRSISSGCVLGAGVAPGARLGIALDDGRSDGVGTEVASGLTVDGACPVALGAGAELGFSDGAELGCSLGACVGSAEGSAVGVCVGSCVGSVDGAADDGSGAGAAVGSVLGFSDGAVLGCSLGAAVGSGSGALVGSGAGWLLGVVVGAALGAADGDGVGLGSGCFWPHCSPSQFIVKLRYQMPP